MYNQRKMSSNKMDIEALNFLIDEFFVNHELEDLEKKSLSQGKELDQLMEEGYKIINCIHFIDSVTKTKSHNKIKLPKKIYNTNNTKKYKNQKMKIIPIKTVSLRLTQSNNLINKIDPNNKSNFSLRNSWSSSETKKSTKIKKYHEMFINKYKTLFFEENEKNPMNISKKDKVNSSLNQINNNSLKQTFGKNPGFCFQAFSYREKKIPNLLNIQKDFKKISTIKKFTINI